jgi:hypothetical protein
VSDVEFLTRLRARRDEEQRMRALMRRRLLRLAESAFQRGNDPSRRVCFLSHDEADSDEVATFIEDFGHVFVPRVLGISDTDDIVESDDSDYVLDYIRENCLRDSTVTIVLIGRCTWSRRFVDWELCSSLRRGKNDERNGLMAIKLPSAADLPDWRAPERLLDNIAGRGGGIGYARLWPYPTGAQVLRDRIEIVSSYRTTRDDLIRNARTMMEFDSACP